MGSACVVGYSHGALVAQLPTLKAPGRAAGLACLQGSNYNIFSLKHGADMAERILRTRLTVLEGAGHNHPLSLQPIIAGHIVEFAGSSAG